MLGAGILLGADWAYKELGWGGYWSWGPVENGSLMPWLTGTAFLHGMMAWRYRRVLKEATIALAFVTFGLCNFAPFLTRSGLFSSLHAFSESPIGWLFLLLMLSLAVGGAIHLLPLLSIRFLCHANTVSNIGHLLNRVSPCTGPEEPRSDSGKSPVVALPSL